MVMIGVFVCVCLFVFVCLCVCVFLCVCLCVFVLCVCLCVGVCTCAKTGKPVAKVGNVYLHNLVDCLTKYDGKFKYSDVVCLKSSYERLSKNAQVKLEKLKIRVEK